MPDLKARSNRGKWGGHEVSWYADRQGGSCRVPHLQVSARLLPPCHTHAGSDEGTGHTLHQHGLAGNGQLPENSLRRHSHLPFSSLLLLLSFFGVCEHVLWRTCGHQRTPCRSQFSPSTMSSQGSNSRFGGKHLDSPNHLASPKAL